MGGLPGEVLRLGCAVLPVQGTWWKDVSALRLLVSVDAYTERPVIDGLLRQRLALLLA